MIKQKKQVLILISLLFFLNPISGEEGMWIPAFLERYIIGKMKDNGLKLTAQDIYNINNGSLKDAVVIFGNGCTGEVISEDGLIMTNHHCAYPVIQAHSSVDNDYLSNGFWAMSREDELPNNDLTVTFLISIEDVTATVLSGVENALTEQQRNNVISENIKTIIDEKVNNTTYQAVVKPFNYGNEYYLFVYQVYYDVRLVGAPPSTIGNFGEDYDNWVWPRHTGDFSLFRIYADKNNNPAAYSQDNVPLKPRKVLPISLKGYNENDFTMVMGYPGTTTEYLTSDGLKLQTEISLPSKIRLREARMNIISRYMSQDDQIRIQYAYKYRNISNSWKKWQGIMKGVGQFNPVLQKENLERQFESWISEDSARQMEFGQLIGKMRLLYDQLSIYILPYEYVSENLLATEIIALASDLRSFFASCKDKTDEEKIIEREKYIQRIKKFYKDYNVSIDTEIFEYMLKSYYTDIDNAFHPDIYNTILKKYKGNFRKFAQKTMKKSLLTSQEPVTRLLSSYPDSESEIFNTILNDPVYQILLSFSNVYNDLIITEHDFIVNQINTLYRSYLRGLQAMDSMKVLYPDANFTMRVAFGKVEGYKPGDGIFYRHYTTINGIIEKMKQDENFAIPSKLLQLFVRKDFGPWKNDKGELPVCFIASNHTSGGNSGSPVMNAEGHLIGLNFDRNWEGTMSDIWYDSSICRNISVDVRYILFIIDKFAGAGYLIDEMDLIW